GLVLALHRPDRQKLEPLFLALAVGQGRAGIDLALTQTAGRIVVRQRRCVGLSLVVVLVRAAAGADLSRKSRQKASQGGPARGANSGPVMTRSVCELRLQILGHAL